MQQVGGLAKPGVVIVTGASTGIGRAVSLRLAAHGYDVYAGVRRSADSESLLAEAEAAKTPLKTVLLDVTAVDQVQAAEERVRAELNGRVFSGVVNNAGIAVASPLEFLPLEDLREQFEVNVIGQVAVAQAFLPLLRDHFGRLVFVGSVSGLVSTRLLGAYAASKFALEAVADAFRRELKPHGVRVSLVEPGRIATPIWDKSLKEGKARMRTMPPEAAHYYGELVDELQAGARNASTGGTSPDVVARAVQRALTDRRSRTRYFVGADAHVVNVLRRLMSDPLLDRLVAISRR